MARRTRSRLAVLRHDLRHAARTRALPQRSTSQPSATDSVRSTGLDGPSAAGGVPSTGWTAADSRSPDARSAHARSADAGTGATSSGSAHVPPARHTLQQQYSPLGPLESTRRQETNVQRILIHFLLFLCYVRCTCVMCMPDTVLLKAGKNDDYANVYFIVPLFASAENLYNAARPDH